MTYDNLLIPLLGETDALFEPVRDWRHNPAVAARMERRSRFLFEGVSYRVGGDLAARKLREVAVDELEAAGLVECFRRHGRRFGWRLNDVTDWQLRDRAGMPGFEPMHVVLRAVAAHTAAGHVNSGTAPETALTGVPWGTRHAAELATALADLPHWRANAEATAIERRFTFADFRSAFALCCREALCFCILRSPSSSRKAIPSSEEDAKCSICSFTSSEISPPKRAKKRSRRAVRSLSTKFRKL